MSTFESSRTTHPADFRDAVLRAANLGDDADTTAAIAGRLYDAGAVELGPGWQHDEFLHAWWVEPGAVLAGEYPGHVDEIRAADKVNLLVDHGVRTFIDLTTPADRPEPYELHVTRAARHRGLDVRRESHPIPDLDVIDHDGYDRIIDAVQEAQHRGGVYIHCWGGVGRTATVIASMLIDQGFDYETTMATITDLRAGTCKADRSAPETDAQRDILRARAGRSA